MNGFFISVPFVSCGDGTVPIETVVVTATTDEWELIQDEMSLYDGLYRFVVKHTLNTRNVTVTASEDGVPVEVEYKRVIDGSTIEVYMENPKNCRITVNKAVPEDFIEGIGFRPLEL